MSRNTLILILMISTIALLMILEGLWLRSAVRDELAQLRRETNFIFRTTLVDLQDSIIRQNIKPMEDGGSDSLRVKTNGIDSFKIFHQRMEVRGDKMPPPSENVQIYINATGKTDSLKPLFFRPLISKFNNGKSFVIRLRGDSLKKSDIERNYGKALREGGIRLPFKVITLKGNEKPPTSSNFNMVTEWVPIMPSSRYVASFEDVTIPVLKKVTPQVLFSLFLTGLTVLSFLFLFRSMMAQQRLMALKNDFISNVTHELKTPIATVSVALEALKDFKGMEDARVSAEYIDMARQELSRLTLLTDKVLTSAILDEHGVKLDAEPIHMDKVILNVMNSMKLVFSKRNAEVSFQPSGNDFTIRGSLIHLTSVVYNLLDNALKYSPKDPNIRIELHDAGERVILVVEDHGIGIPGEFHQKILEKFFRMPSGDIHNVKGHGLGLSYVDSVVKAHGGSIELKSQPGEGSRFTIYLPKQS